MCGAAFRCWCVSNCISLFLSFFLRSKGHAVVFNEGFAKYFDIIVFILRVYFQAQVVDFGRVVVYFLSRHATLVPDVSFSSP